MDICIHVSNTTATFSVTSVHLPRHILLVTGKLCLTIPHIFEYYQIQAAIKTLNPCGAKTVYVRFQSNFRLNKIPLKFVTYFVVDAQLIK